MLTKEIKIFYRHHTITAIEYIDQTTKKKKYRGYLKYPENQKRTFPGLYLTEANDGSPFTNINQVINEAKYIVYSYLISGLEYTIKRGLNLNQNQIDAEFKTLKGDKRILHLMDFIQTNRDKIINNDFKILKEESYE